MMLIPIDPSISADQTFDVLIPEEIVLNLRILWNSRAEAWYLTVVGPDGTELDSLRMVPNFPLMHSHEASSPLTGDLLVLPLGNEVSDDSLDWDALGKSWGLFYLSEDEVTTWRTAYGLAS